MCSHRSCGGWWSSTGSTPASIPGSGKEGRITRADVLAFIDRQAVGGCRSSDHGPSAGTASAALLASSARAREAPQAAPAAAGASQEIAATHSYLPMPARAREVVPFTNIRRLTAEHMVRSKATSAHTLAVIEADYEGIDRVRKEHKDRFREEEGISLTYLPFIARAVVRRSALPHLNASVGDDMLSSIAMSTSGSPSISSSEG